MFQICYLKNLKNVLFFNYFFGLKSNTIKLELNTSKNQNLKFTLYHKNITSDQLFFITTCPILI